MNSKTNSKEKILLAASNLFQTKGYAATGLNEILKESGAPKGSLYYYFPNGKEELALEAIKLAKQAICSKLKITLNSHSNPIQAIQALIKNITRDLKETNELQDMSLSLIALETYSSSQILRIACCEAFLSLQNIYTEKLLESGLPKDTANELGKFIQILIEGAITVSVTEKSPDALLTVSNQIEILLKSYLHKE